MARLTKRKIDAATYEGDGKARHVLWDSEVPGFGCRVYPSGKKAFVLSYRVNIRKRLLTLGAYGALTLDQARKLARREVAKVEGGSADPLEERQKATRGETVADLCVAYMERHGNAKKSGHDDQRRIDGRSTKCNGSIQGGEGPLEHLRGVSTQPGSSTDSGRLATFDSNRTAGRDHGA